MVLEELLPMLSSMGMDTSRVGFLGWSMGGYGALLLGAQLGPARTAGICAISPALYTSFTGSAPGAFDSYDDWVQHSVYGPAGAELDSACGWTAAPATASISPPVNSSTN